MATKEELASDSAQYESLLETARFHLGQGNHLQALDFAILTFPYIDGMMQFGRKYAQREFETIGAIEIVLRCAPLHFVTESLTALHELLTEKKRINKNTQQDLKEKLARAREQLQMAYRLWSHIERHPDCRQDDLRKSLGGDQDTWRSIAEYWASVGVLQRTPESNSYRLRLLTELDDAVVAKCPGCGVSGKTKKSKCLDLVSCPKCKQSVQFVILSLA